MKLGYVVLETRREAEWRALLERTYGLPAPQVNPDGSLGYRIDEAAQRLVLADGEAEDLQAVGLELPSSIELRELEARLAAAGVPYEAASDERRRARQVDELVVFRDPAGNVIEACVGIAIAGPGQASELFPAGFVADDKGFGHVALVHRDLESMERFYVDVLGFGVSERHAGTIGPIPIRGLFLHCNRRHHSIAVFDLPIAKRVHHVMLETRDARSVARAYERACRLGVPLSLELGQHAAPDGTFSFYGVTPSGFELEIGSDSGEIDPATWRALEPKDARAAQSASAWGHRPTLRTKMKIVNAILAHWLALR